MRHYPVFLDLRKREVLVVGAGKVALRKTRGLLQSEARITVVAPRWMQEFEELPVRLVGRRFRDTDLQNVALVFAATDDRKVNQHISQLARRRGLLANVADSAEECDFIVPARLDRAGVQIAIATGGRDPRLSAELRRRLERLSQDGRLRKEHGLSVYLSPPTRRSITKAVSQTRQDRIRELMDTVARRRPRA